MKHLAKYLETVNFSRVHFEKKPAYTVGSLTAKDAAVIADHLVASMSPENLTCDGELSRAEVQRRVSLYRNAAADLLAIFPKLKPEWDDCGLFDAQAVVDTSQFKVGQNVVVNHAKLGGRATGKILKVNRVKCRVEFAKGTFNVPFSFLETA